MNIKLIYKGKPTRICADCCGQGTVPSTVGTTHALSGGPESLLPWRWKESCVALQNHCHTLPQLGICSSWSTSHGLECIANYDQNLILKCQGHSWKLSDHTQTPVSSDISNFIHYKINIFCLTTGAVCFYCRGEYWQSSSNSHTEILRAT